MRVAELVIVSAVLMVCGVAHQAFVLWRNKSSKDISLIYSVVVLLYSSINFALTLVSENDASVVVTQALNLLAILTVLGFVVYYRMRK